ncbi:hypothetical protein GOAMR_04_00690 [Gordonia amarae NBRC 15530]|uniref:Uncharacterized protein n=2 Tax=Gordonia amarae TaxID=36821 RepID=G7GJH6_9ACTN|nr:hypothetical protein GOAMR_04_00690 [Gordonia amarae NBRC 15530]
MSVRVIVAAIAALVSGATLWFPWWRADDAPWVVTARVLRGDPATSPGWEVVGKPAALLLVVVPFLVVAALRRRGALAAAGICAGAAIMTGLAAHALIGVDVTPAPIVALVCGLVSGALAIGPAATCAPARALAVVAVIAVALVAVVLPLPSRGSVAAPPAVPAAFERVTAAGFDTDPEGIRGLVTPSLQSRLGLLSGRPVLYDGDTMTAVGDDGRTRILMRTERRTARILGTYRDSIAVQAGTDVTVIDGDGSVSTLGSVATAGDIGTDGTVWMRALDGSVRVGQLASGLPADAGQLPSITPAVTDVAGLVPSAAGALRSRRAGSYGYRLELLTPDGTVTRLAGAADESCGSTSDPVRSYFAGEPVAQPDGKGGWWIAHEVDRTTRVSHVDAAGVQSRIADPLPGLTRGMTVDADSSVLLYLMHGAYDSFQVVRTTTEQLSPLKPPADTCLADVPRLAPPLRTVPVAGPAARYPIAPLDLGGTYVSSRAGQDTWTIFDANGTERASWRHAPIRNVGGSPISDGMGGLWWLEESGRPATGTSPSGAGDDPHLTVEASYNLTLTHGEPGRAPVRLALDPTTFGSAALIPDVRATGRPLLLSSDGLWRVSDRGSLARVASGEVVDAVRATDGALWVATWNTVERITGTTRTTVVGPREKSGNRSRTVAPVGIQLAHGVRPGAVVPRSPQLVAATDGAVWVIADHIVLRADRSGAVSLAAQDEVNTSRRIYPVPGGALVLDTAPLNRWSRLVTDTRSPGISPSSWPVPR